MHCNYPEENSANVKPLLDMHDICIHSIYACDDNVYPVRYGSTHRERWNPMRGTQTQLQVFN